MVTASDEGKVILECAKNRPCGYFRAVLLESEDRILDLAQASYQSHGSPPPSRSLSCLGHSEVLTMTHSHFTIGLCTHRTEVSGSSALF